MDKHGRAKISYFQTTKLLKQDQNSIDTEIRGTRGYVALEWHQSQLITAKVDVYSSRIMLLEIICCTKNVDWKLRDEVVLENWAYSCYEARHLKNLIGDNTDDIYQSDLEGAVGIKFWSIQYDLLVRPSMKKVLFMLEGSVDIPIPLNQISILSYIEYASHVFALEM